MKKRIVLLGIALVFLGALTFNAGVAFSLKEEASHILIYLFPAAYLAYGIIEAARSRKILTINEKQLRTQSYIVLSKLLDGKILLDDHRAGQYLLADFKEYPPNGYREAKKGEYLVLIPEKWKTYQEFPQPIPG